MTAEPFTLDHFRAWVDRMEATLDTGARFTLEPFQEEIVADLFAGFREVWLIVPEGTRRRPTWPASPCTSLDPGRSPWSPGRRLARPVRDRLQAGRGLRPPLAPPARRLPPRSRATADPAPPAARRSSLRRRRRTGDGVIPTDAFIDELHRHEDLPLYRTWSGSWASAAGRSPRSAPRASPAPIRGHARDDPPTRSTITAPPTYARRPAWPPRVRHPRGRGRGRHGHREAGQPVPRITARTLRQKYDKPRDPQPIGAASPATPRPARSRPSPRPMVRGETEERIPEATRCGRGGRRLGARLPPCPVLDARDRPPPVRRPGDHHVRPATEPSRGPALKDAFQRLSDRYPIHPW